MKTVAQMYKYLKDHTASDFEGGHAAFIPRTLVNELIDHVDLKGTILVTFNVEFLISLVYDFNVDPKQITFYADHPNKIKFAERIGVEYTTSLANLKSKSVDYVFLNPPFGFHKPIRNTCEKIARKKVVITSDINSIEYPGSFDNIEYFRILGGTVFNARAETCYAVIDLTGSKTDITIVNNEGVSLKVNSVPHLPSKDLTLWSDSIKVCELGLPGYNIVWSQLDKNKIRVTKEGIKIITFNGRRNEDFKYVIGDEKHITDIANYGMHKVIMAKNGAIGKLGPLKYAGPDFGCSHGVLSLAFASEKEARDAIEYLSSPDVAKLVKGLKTKTCVNGQTIFSKIPQLAYKGQWEHLLTR